MSDSQIRVKKRNGNLANFEVNKINKCAERACAGLDGVSASELVIDSQIRVFDKITTEEIDRTLLLEARGKMYKEPNWGIVASRILASCVYKEVLKESVDSDTFESDYRAAFIKNIKRGVKEGILSEKMLNFDLKRLAAKLVPARDDTIDYVGMQNLSDRYFLRDRKKKLLETPQAFYMRVAMGVSLPEFDFGKMDPNEMVEALYEIYSTKLASPSTPTLFNAGTVHNQLISCFLTSIPDSIDGIFDGLWQEARKSKYAGGLGFHVTSIRATGSNISGTNGKSSGLIPWLKIYNDMLIACDQAGKRAGSGCAYLEPWHLDVEEFLDLRKSNGEERRRCHDLNTALWTPDLFFKRVQEEGRWTLFCPSECPDLHESFGADFEEKYVAYEKLADQGKLKLFKIIKAKDLWKLWLKSLFETSHPWVVMKDISNKRYSNKHQGIIHGSNLCVEIDLHNKPSKYVSGEKTEIGETAVCCLSSININEHADDKGKVDKDKVSNTVKWLIRALDNVIEQNYFPTKEADKSGKLHRALGLGCMGNFDLYAKKGIACDSDKAIEIADQLFELISYSAISASADLAQERGSYPTFEGSEWSKGIVPIDNYEGDIGGKGKLDWDSLREKVKKGMRNSNLMAVAPNASIAYQHGCEQSHEPLFSVLFRYENKSGNYFIVNKHFVKSMKELGVWSPAFAEAVKAVDGDVLQLDIPQKYKDLYKKCFDRDMFKLIDACAARQKWVDQGLSFNMYNGGTSLKYLNDIYMHAWKRGLKSTYYLRNKPASKVSSVTVDQAVIDKEKKEKEAKEINELLDRSRAAAEKGEACESCQG